MKLRRVVITLEVETNVPIGDLKGATLYVQHTAWPRGRDAVKDDPRGWQVHYMEANRIDVIRASKKARGKR